MKQSNSRSDPRLPLHRRPLIHLNPLWLLQSPPGFVHRLTRCGTRGSFFIRWLTTVLSALMLSAASVAQVLPKPDVIGSSWVYSTEGLYHNVRDDLLNAIADEGLVVSYTAHLASMLRRTREATGAVEQVYDNAQSILFCKSDLTYELTLNNPHNITLCPYSISIYTLSAEPETVYLSIRSPELEQPDYAAIHQLLEQIIAATLNW